MDEFIVGFSRPKGGFEPFSWLIRLFTWSPFSHAYIKFYSAKYDRWLIYQASGLKVNFIGSVRFNAAEVICSEFSLPVSDDARLKTIKFAIDECGVPYGIKEIIGMCAVLVCRMFGKKIKNPLSDGNASFVCSELIAEILNDIMTEQDKLDPETSSPKDVYNFLISKGYKPLVAA